jgi:hypothetical protein
MILTMAMVNIVGPAYSSMAAATKLEQEYQLHPGYAGSWSAMLKV